MKMQDTLMTVLEVTRYITGSNDNYFETSGEYTTYNGVLNLGIL